MRDPNRRSVSAARVVLNGLTCLTAAVGFACEHGRPPGDGQNERVGLDAPHEAAELRVASPGMPDSVKMLTPSREFVGSGSWGAVAEVVALGDSLFVYDLYGPPAVTVLDRETGGVVGTFGRKGRGPGEFQDMSDVFADQAVPGQFWIYDAPARRLSLYGPGDSAGVGLLRTVPLQVRGYVPYLRLTRTGLMMAGVFDDGSPVVLSDTSGGHMRERYGAYPAHRPGDPSNTALRANEPEVTYRPHGSGLAVAYRHFNLLQFYDLESGRVVSVVGPNPFEPRPEDLVDLNPKKFAYAKVRSTARYVYALFCGCTNRDRSRPLLLQVFTWDGELVTVVAIDHRSWQWVFDVSPDDRFIYTMTEHPQPLVLETALPPRLRDPARSP